MPNEILKPSAMFLHHCMGKECRGCNYRTYHAPWPTMLIHIKKHVQLVLHRSHKRLLTIVYANMYKFVVPTNHHPNCCYCCRYCHSLSAGLCDQQEKSPNPKQQSPHRQILALLLFACWKLIQDQTTENIKTQQCALMYRIARTKMC